MEHINTIAGLITSLTIIGGALIWIYQSVVIKPNQELIIKEQDRSNQALKDAVEPLTKSIDTLNVTLKTFQEQQEDLFKITDEHTRQIGEIHVELDKIKEGE